MAPRRSFVLLALSVGCASPREPGGRAASPGASPGAPALSVTTDAGASRAERTVSSASVMAAMLVAHIEDTKRRVSHASLGADRVWTDGAILERAAELPPPLDDHLRRVPAGPVPREKMVDLLERVEKERARGHAATLVRVGGGEFGCRFEGAGVSARTNCVYASYVEARYPAASLVVTGPYEPVIVVVGPTVRAVIMPVK